MLARLVVPSHDYYWIGDARAKQVDAWASPGIPGLGYASELSSFNLTATLKASIVQNFPGDLPPVA